MTMPVYFCTDLMDERLDYYGRSSFMVAVLDGIPIFQLDNVEGMPYNGVWWIALKHYLEENPTVSLDKLQVRFRSHVIDIPASPVYYYSRGLIEHMGVDTNTSFHHVIGIYVNDKIECTWYKSPELLPAKYSIKELDKCKENSLIWAKREQIRVVTSPDTAVAI